MTAITDDRHYKAIAAAIRNKGHEGTMTPPEMGPAILAIVGGDGDYEYVPTEMKINPASAKYKYHFYLATYTYTSESSITVTFDNPTTEPVYAVLGTTSGFTSSSSSKRYYDITDSQGVTTRKNYPSNVGYEHIIKYTIPTDTKKVVFYITQYLTSYGSDTYFCLTEDDTWMEYGQVTDKQLISYFNSVPMMEVNYSIELSTNAEANKWTWDIYDRDVVFESKEVVTPGYLKWQEGIVYEVEGGKY